MYNIYEHDVDTSLPHRITQHLGSGEFGTVCKGVWHTDQADLDVAVKMLNCKASEVDTVRFLQEAAIMGQFRHPNVVRLHGVVTVGEPVGWGGEGRERGGERGGCVCVCGYINFMLLLSLAGNDCLGTCKEW